LLWTVRKEKEVNLLLNLRWRYWIELL
jgi:hypothetical protein